jgi:hypothetical protein
VRASTSDSIAPTMNTSPCAKLMSCRRPYTIVYPNGDQRVDRADGQAR